MVTEFENAVVALLSSPKFRSKKFYAYLIQQAKVMFTDKVPTAGVSVTDRLNLYVNPDFFKSLTLEQRIDLLEHECLHIVNDHASRMKRLNTKNMRKWNAACDYANNHGLDSLREMGLFVEDLQKKIDNVNTNETAEYYYEVLTQLEKENPEEFEKIMGKGPIDDHAVWEEAEGIPEELKKEVIKEALNEAVKDAKARRGSVPWAVEIALDKLRDSTVDWRRVLRNFAARTNYIDKTTSRKKRNRRYGLVYPGKAKSPKGHLAVVADNSGSVSDNYFTQFLSELDGILDTGMEITFIQADTEVNSVQKYEKGMEIKRTGQGGTLYKPGIDKAMELKPDGIIYFGDGDVWMEDVDQPPVPFLWAITEGGKQPYEWGQYCEVKLGGEL